MRTFDAAIVGGGPAGAALACTLAGDGWQVLLVDDDRLRPTAPRETLLAAAKPGLQRAGVWELVAEAGTPDPLRHGAVWGDDELRFRTDEEPGLLLERGPFDRRMREAAAARGVHVRAGRAIGPLGGADGECTVVGPEGGRDVFRARFVVLATGRRSQPGLVRLHEVHRGPATAALTLLGTTGTRGRPLAVVEAVPQGFFWYTDLPDGAAAATLLCDAQELAATGVRALVAAARTAAHGPVRSLGAPRLAWAVRATPRWHTTDDPVLLLGDAAATIDPLSTQGVEKALAGADHAAAVLRAAREHPEWWPRLLTVHSRWEHGLAAAHAATTAEHLHREGRFAAAPYWRARRPAAKPVADTIPAGVLQPAPEIGPAQVLQRRGNTFVATDGVRRGEGGDELSHVGFVPVAPVLAAFRGGRDLASGVAAAGADPRVFVLPPAAVRAAAEELFRRGWLRSSAAAVRH